MRKLYNTILLITAIMFANQIQASNPFAAGQGTANDPFKIENAEQLNYIRGEYLDKYFVQIAHIDMGISPYNSGNGWNPIGGNNTNDRFTGNYDGGGFKISNLYINRPGASNVGLFGHIGMNETGITTIRNVKLENVNIIGGRGTGSLVGRVTGNQNTRIENCSVNLGEVRGGGATGGLVGSNNSYMTNSAAAEGFRPVIYMCSANVSVSLREGAEGNKDKFGGLAGCNQKGLISNSFSHGSVTVDGGTRVGGLAGCVELRGIIINSYSTGLVSGTGTSLMGGLLGMAGTGSNLGTTINCYWDKTTSGIESSASGTGLTTAEMKSENSFNEWDFESIWEIQEGQGYPKFKNESFVADIWVWNTSTTDNYWSKGSNWDDQLEAPVHMAKVLIPSGANVYPVFTGSIILDDLEIENGASLTLEDGSIMTVKDSLIGGGTITGGGTLVLQGNGTQTIPSMVFTNLTIDNPNNVKLGGDITVNGVLKMESGFLDLNGHQITLGDEAFLVEMETVNTASRIYGKRGSIVTTRMLSAPQGENIAGMGIQITGNEMGQTTIRRGHSVQFDDDISKSIMRWFDISPEYNSGLNATMVFNYFQGEVNTPAQFEDVGFSLYKPASEPEEWIHIESTLNTVERKLTATNLGGFSRWTAGSSLIHLPVALLSFDAAVRNNEVVLQWTTASEINNDYFTIERSTDGRSFETVGIVNGAGNSNRLITYTKTDNEPIKGISYYRLKQIDYDGSFEYSQLVSVKFNETKPSEILLYPNPNNGVFRVQNTGAEVIPFRIYDLQGRLVVASETDPMSIKEFNHSNLKIGLYTIVFEGEDLQTLKMQVR